MGIEDILLNVDMGWTDTALYRKPSVNVTALSSFVVGPPDPLLELRRVLERGVMVSFSAQSLRFIESVRRCGFLALGRLVSTSAGRVGAAWRRWPALLTPSVITRVVYLGITTFVMELWLNLYLALHYRDEGQEPDWRVAVGDVRRWVEKGGTEFVPPWLVPVWLAVGWLMSGLITSGWSAFGWSPKAWMLVAWLLVGIGLLSWYLASQWVEIKRKREEKAQARLENGMDSPGSSSDECVTTAGRGVAPTGKRRGKGRKSMKKKKKSLTF